MKRLFLTFLTSLVLCGVLLASGNEGADKAGQSLFDAWSTDNTNIELHVNFDTLESNRRTVDQIPAKVIQNGQELDLSVSVRGRFRRVKCAMPPLKLQFKKSGLRALGLNTHNDFKLVTHCTNDEAGQDALLREQLAYELYNTVAPEASFRTQLLTITYVNTVDGSTTTSYAILIEDYDELKGRLDTRNCKDLNLPAASITNAETVALFQYMIGNNDYGVTMSRNLKLVENKTTGAKTFIPYDFDYTGLVNAGYATGADHFGTEQVTDRVLLWEYIDTPDFTAAADYMSNLKDTLLNQVLNFEELSGSSKREVAKYLKGFFRDLAKMEFNLAK